jgi:hypothetical protein
MLNNVRNETIEDTEMERFIRGPHIGQSIFADQREEYKAWYRDFVTKIPNLAIPRR